MIWGKCLTEENKDKDLGLIQPCSPVLDVGDSVTAISASHILASDGRYVYFVFLRFPYTLSQNIPYWSAS